jgi:hypothetical protein
MSTLTASASDKNPPAQLFYAVRKCDHLMAPAIFLHWEDCCFYVDIKENRGHVDYHPFELITDAIKYVTSQHHNEDRTIVDQKASTNKSPAPAASIKRTAVESYMDSMKPPDAASTKRAAVTAYIDNTKPPAASTKRADVAAYSALMAASAQRTPFGAYIDNTKPPVASAKRTAVAAYIDNTKPPVASAKRTPPFGAYSALMATSVKSPPMSKSARQTGKQSFSC